MSNPIFTQRMTQSDIVLNAEPMSVSGTINKCFVLFGIMLVSSFFTWNLFFQGAMDKVNLLTTVGAVLGFVLYLVILFNTKTARVLAPAYAVCEGLVLGGLSGIFEKSFPGIVMSAVGLTFAAFGVTLLLYRTGVVRYTEKFRSVLMVSMFSILGIYLISFLGSFFGMQIPQIFSSSPIGIGFSVLVCIIAAANFIMDFDFIEQGSRNFLSKDYEWLASVGLLVTLVWLYMEVLRLLAKLRDR